MGNLASLPIPSDTIRLTLPGRTECTGWSKAFEIQRNNSKTVIDIQRVNGELIETYDGLANGSTADYSDLCLPASTASEFTNQLSKCIQLSVAFAEDREVEDPNLNLSKSLPTKLFILHGRYCGGCPHLLVIKLTW